MWKIAAAGVTARFVSASPFAYAQSYPAETRDRLTAAEWKTLTDLRIDLVKGALQLTPDQTKYWAAVEDAIRTRAKNRQARIENIAETVGKRAGESPMLHGERQRLGRGLLRLISTLGRGSAQVRSLPTARRSNSPAARREPVA